MYSLKSKKGFTLIELLVVIGILAVLLAITLIAVNPGQQLQQADDTKRKSDINTILGAVNQYMIKNQGQVPAGVSETVAVISKTGADLCEDLVPEYVASLPQDPSSNGGGNIADCASAYSTGYQISAVDNRVTVYAPNANGGTLTVSR
jgi:prepilin-type N-terminal cleavage/methylation domain-containing protein